MEIAGDNVPFFNIISANDFSDSDGTTIVTDSNPANAMLYMNNFSSHIKTSQVIGTLEDTTEPEVVKRQAN
ncbi:hypothetical protein ABEG29_14220 [Escherichia coli]|nr:hypothetical protein [Escherichia coli]KLG47676.1 hypothetical protein WQ74_25245 [Escherichia coli]KNY95120.1 hypothetical protein AGA37_19695 [Escherichia coli]